MNQELVFRIVFAVLGVGVVAIRWRIHHLTGWKSNRPAFKKNPLDTVLLYVCSLAWKAAFVLYVIFPHFISPCHVELSVWFRIFGVGLAVAAMILLAWSDHCLAENFSATLQIKDGQTLITTGPYAWVRHPIYVSGLLLGPATFLISANWLVGLCFVGGVTLLFVFRIPREERMLIEHFGDQYREYARRTGGLWPRITRSKW